MCKRAGYNLQFHITLRKKLKSWCRVTLHALSKALWIRVKKDEISSQLLTEKKMLKEVEKIVMTKSSLKIAR